MGTPQNRGWPGEGKGGNEREERGKEEGGEGKRGGVREGEEGGRRGEGGGEGGGGTSLTQLIHDGRMHATCNHQRTLLNQYQLVHCHVHCTLQGFVNDIGSTRTLRRRSL